jgi:hypothetical protein
VIQDVEILVEKLPEFLDWFDAEIGMRPVWLCPLRLREREWPTYPLTLDTTFLRAAKRVKTQERDQSQDPIGRQAEQQARSADQELDQDERACQQRDVKIVHEGPCPGYRAFMLGSVAGWFRACLRKCPCGIGHKGS